MKSSFLRFTGLTLLMSGLLFPAPGVIAQTSSPRLNELLVHPRPSPQHLGRSLAWVEIYNPTLSVLLLSDMSLSDSLGQPRKYVVPEGTMLPPMGYLIVTFGPEGQTGWRVRPNSGTIYLFSNRAQGTNLIDSVSYGIQARDYSLGRVPDGSGDWVLTIPTPAATNQVASLGSPTELKINEWMSANQRSVCDPDDGEYDDWLELYNPGLLPVSLAGLYLSDDPDRNWTMYRIPDRSFIGTGNGAYTVFFADGTDWANHVPFKLSRDGENIALFTPDGSYIDLVRTRYPPADISEGRMPDGSTNIILFSTNLFASATQPWGLTASPGAANPFPSILRLDSPAPAQGMRLRFMILSNLACTVQYQDQEISAPWQYFTNFSAAPSNRTVELVDPSPPGTQRLYRAKND